ncbi:thiopeptide-type bacteriocin biosynthesis protein [Flagellimonas sp.]|uniref:thiopeptide-type bacteriocin biosynthesis protein n=1 Tax=Flagellimonas sp. TaxID=2058762 RepID=UPI003AB11068
MTKRVTRTFIVGSEWLYYKIYTGHKTSDKVLTEIIKPISIKLIKKGVIEKWFFIRYADPNHHIRVRFLINNPKKINEVISILYGRLNDFIEQDLIWKIEIDTYKRELERYGLQTMELSETLFYHDSNSIVKFLDLIEGSEGEQLRWLFGLRSIDHLLSSFNYSIEEKLELLSHLKTGFGKEFGMTRFLKKQLDDKYRKEREKIESFVTFTRKSHPSYEPILKILNTKGKAIKPLAEQILYLHADRKLQLEINNLMESYTHMLMNRLFKSKNRLNEMVVYDFLYRYYKSAFALKYS